MAPKRILVSGATGQQGNAVIQALVKSPPPFDHEILALTRNVNSSAAKKLALHDKVALIAGDLNDCEAIFASAGGKDSIWGVFSMQLPDQKHKPGQVSKETQQGCALIDAALANGVKHFVYSGVDRGGEQSWENATPIPHFMTKHDIESYLRKKAQGSEMTWTILRPTAFMDNFGPNLFGRVMAAVMGQIEPKKLQMVAVKDIGIFAANAFSASERDDYKNAAISLAGDDINYKEANEAFWEVFGRPLVQTYWIVPNFLGWMIPDVGIMFKWFGTDGYDASVERCRELNSEMLDFKTWLREESKYSR